MNFQQLFRPSDLLRGGRNGIGEGIGDAQLLPFEEAEGVVGENLHTLNGLERRDELCGPAQAVFVVGQAGYQHMPDPERNAQIRNMLCHRENVGIVLAGELTMFFRVDLLEVKDNETGNVHQAVELGQILRVCPKRLTGRVERGVDAFFACQREELGQKLHLTERLTAADRDAALFAPVVAVAVDALEQLFRRPLLAAVGRPGLGVVTVLAPQCATLQKNHEPDARPIY